MMEVGKVSCRVEDWKVYHMAGRGRVRRGSKRDEMRERERKERDVRECSEEEVVAIPDSSYCTTLYSVVSLPS